MPEDPETTPPQPVPEPPVADPAAELKASLQRVQADFQNYRARMDRERAQWRDDLVAEAVGPLLGAFDNLWRALDAAKTGGTLEALLQGVTQVRAQVEKSLGEMQVVRVECEGKVPDPKLHEVIAQVPAPPGVAPGAIAYVVEQGYTVRGRLIRPARVAVAVAAAEGA